MMINILNVETMKKFQLEIENGQTVRSIKQIALKHFMLDLIQINSFNVRAVLEFNGSELNDDWIFSDLNIRNGSTVKLLSKKEKIPDYLIYVRFKKQYLKMVDTQLTNDSYVFELRVKISQILGIPLSVFCLKTQNDIDLFDDNKISCYKLNDGEPILLETWKDWDSFLINCIKGYKKQVIKEISLDESIKQFQMKVALFIGCFYGNFELVNTLMFLGARSDKPVGNHPCRQWIHEDYQNFQSNSERLNYLKKEYLKCPLHAAILNGQLKIVTLIANTSIHVLEKTDGYGLPPWRLALHNNHKDPIKNANQKDVARFLLYKRFGGKVKISDDCKVSIFLFSRIKNWIENAKERVLFLYGISKSSIKKRPFIKEGLLGNKVLIDGFNNDFVSHLNAYERLREKYKYYYFKDDDDRDRHGYPDLYFKTVGLIKENKLMNKNNEKNKKGILKSHQSEKPIPKTYELWKRAFNKIIFYKTILKYAEILLALDVEIDLDELKVIQESEDNLSFIEDRNFSTEKSFIKEKTLSSRSTPRIKSRSEKRAARARTKSAKAAKNKKSQEMKSSREKLTERVNLRNAKLKERVTTLPDLVNHLNKSSKIQKPIIVGNEYYNCRMLNGLVVYRKETNEKNDLFQLYKKRYCDNQSLKQNALETFEKAKTFKGTWLGHINLSVKMARSNALRKFNSLPLINNKNDS